MGLFKSHLEKYVSNIPGKPAVKKLKKTAILGTAHADSTLNQTI